VSDEIPEGYGYAPSPSAFPNHVGRIFSKTVDGPDGEPEKWTALRVAEHHVNSWGLAHGGLIAFLAEVATAGAAWDPEGPPVVTVSLTTQFLRAPKLGQLLEMRARATRRTRSMVFVEAHAFADGELQFTASALNKIIGG
jgi:uncharacterized protein (TIGR00369 family)